MSTGLTHQDIARTRLIVGLEIHVELSTRSKMFTRAANPACPEFEEAAPNTLVDPLVAALPGTLPVMNRRAIEMSAMVGMALGCSIAEHAKWDRKNYAYPDLPKGYQIRQYDLPLCFDGAVDIPCDDSDIGGRGTKRIGIIRAHLEEDTGKLGHELPGGGSYAGSLVDLNRAGTPLLEIVTEPDFDRAEDVLVFARELRSICRFLGVTEGVMQKGHMRFEPNINVVIDTTDGREFRTPVVEIKNLNSFRAVEGAIRHEEVRQVDEFLETGRVMGRGMKQTRGWDDQKLVTVLQREKEDAHDYRYFPEPDLIPVEMDEAWKERIRRSIPELPLPRRARYQADYGLPAKDAEALVDERELCLWFERVVEAQLAEASPPSAREAGHEAAKLILNQMARRANECGVGPHELGVTPEQVGGLLGLRREGTVPPQAVDRLLELAADSPDPVGTLAEANGLVVVRDEGAMESWIDRAIEAQAQAAEDVRNGKDAAIGRLVGAVMKASGGQADAREVRERIFARLRG
ncbi:MAG: Asp-tRNA(Asn)/Glu-tRNA(Gln) amidotransferase subunit GatB [Planctomycetota bacterium]|nr:Asp-tRNA(Asn)/Glu-tRNA(Gln) amidotransferase subunit GatB [Planctomycetota bacterium]